MTHQTPNTSINDPDTCPHHDTYWDDDSAPNRYYEVCRDCGAYREVNEYGIPYTDSSWEE